MKTPKVQIGSVTLGDTIVIQSMTNTDTADAQATANQCMELADAGAEMIRMTVNTDEAAKALPEIREILNRNGYESLPLIGDFHYNGHLLLKNHPECAQILDKYRINPGNVGFGEKHDYNFAQIIEIAIANEKAIRIGVNGGSLDQDLFTEMMDENAKCEHPKTDTDVMIDAIVESALRSAKAAEELGLKNNKIVLSVKMSSVQDMVAASKLLAKKSEGRYAIHLGLTEAGGSLQGIVSSSAALAIVLNEGIGDTIRVSLTPDSDTPRTMEVEVCKQLLQSLGYRYFRPQITSCPGCGRTSSTFFQELAKEISQHIDKSIKEWRVKYPGVEKLKIAVMGCVVNGPGEASHADIAISLPGKMEKNVAPVYIGGEYSHSLQGDNITDEFIKILEDYIKKTYSG